jgi:methionyl aminopeptidase
MFKSSTIFYKSSEEIELIRTNCLLVCSTLAVVAKELKPGVSPQFLDKLAEDFIRSNGALPGFKGYRGFPSTLCFSANEVVVHGIPTKTEVKEGDIISVDCGVAMNGYFGDAAYTFLVGEVDQKVVELCRATNQSLYKGINAAIVNNRVGDIGYAIQSFVETSLGYGVVRDLVGHGIGKNLHESPDVPNFGTRGRGPKLKEGLVIAIEPMVNLGIKDVVQLSDGWTIVSKDRKPSAHYEHTIAVTTKGPDILSDHKRIEEEIKKNINLTSL